MVVRAEVARFLGRADGAADSRELVEEYLRILATLGDAEVQKLLLKDLVGRVVELERKVDGLLSNTLPRAVAERIKTEGAWPATLCDCTILCSDLSGYTRIAEHMDPRELTGLLHRLFSQFDELMTLHHGTKIKTIGDAYMAAFGTPEPVDGHAAHALRAGLAMQAAVTQFNRDHGIAFGMRIGIHTGPLVAAVVGRDRMQFDVFGDSVNVASRFESTGAVGRVSLSDATRLAAGDGFLFEDRGAVELKNRGAMAAYFLIGERQ